RSNRAARRANGNEDRFLRAGLKVRLLALGGPSTPQESIFISVGSASGPIGPCAKKIFRVTNTFTHPQKDWALFRVWLWPLLLFQLTTSRIMPKVEDTSGFICSMSSVYASWGTTCIG